MDAQDGVRQLEKGWDWGLVAAAFFVSFLGVFTSTQLMIQARLSSSLFTAFTWVAIISLTFGFCASWGLHFVGMLSCKLDLAVGLDVGLTMFSAALAITFTFAALGTELLWERYKKDKRRVAPQPERNPAVADELAIHEHDSSVPLLREGLMNGHENGSRFDEEMDLESESNGDVTILHSEVPPPKSNTSSNATRPMRSHIEFAGGTAEPSGPEMPPHSIEHRDSGSQSGLGIESTRLNLKSMADHGTAPTINPFVATYEGILGGMSWKALGMGLVWSLSLTCMHYGGLLAMNIPGGYLTLNPFLVILSAIISWVVCLVGYIYLVNIEPHLSQQVLFATVAASGIGAMHFTGLRATTFWSRLPPAQIGGYPQELPIAICTIAILTCMLANGLLAHDATVSRNKLAEIVWTRRKLWRAIAQKENAEAAAAARSNFIASASHEIRTPLHHLQGYSDLLSKANLSDDARQLVTSIQSATKTLSLIANNVLDWSKLESDRDTSCRLTPLDVRSVVESILVLLPHQDERNDVEILAVVAPSVPETLMLDETYIHRILMNLLSNSLKFTCSGFVMLSLEMDDGDLIAKVTDSGTGIPSSFVPHLFEPFSQAGTRGTQRGTGLGLSIVRQLLHKMQGHITVQSRHVDDGYRPNETGSIFTLTMPVQMSPSATVPQGIESHTVALLSPPPRLAEGLQIAWDLFGCKTVVVRQFSELANHDVKYVWAESSYLTENIDCLRYLLSQPRYTTLVPLDHQEALHRLPGVLSAPHFVPLSKPLMWHTFNSRIDIASRAAAAMKATPLLESASTSEAGNDWERQRSPEGSVTSKSVNVLLVEDNVVNRKLCNRMLTSLGYSVILANDGQEAIDQILKHDKIVDMILMDQSMPIKDGVTAARDIRTLESTGQLSRRHPIIALTAVVSTESRALFKNAGADDFLSKPLSLAKLEQTLATFLRVE